MVTLRRWRLLLFLPFAFAPAFHAAEQKLGDLRGVSRAAFNHDASRVITRGAEGTVTIWELPAGTPVTGELKSDASAGFLMSGDSKVVLVGMKDGHSRVFDPATAKGISPLVDLPLKADFQMPGLFSPDDNTVLLFADKEAAVFDVRSGKRLATLPLSAGPNEEATGSAAFAANGAHCFMMDGGGRVTDYDTKDWKPMGKPMEHPAADMAYDFEFTASEDGKWLATFDSPGENGPKGQLQVWDAVAGKPLGKPLVAVNGLVARFVGANRVAIIPSRGGDASVRELPSMKIAYSFRSHDDLDGPRLDVSPDRKWIVTWGADRRLDLFDAATGKLASNYPGTATISKVIMSPDSSGCYVVFDNTAFLLQGHHDNYVVKLSFPELKITETLRVTDYLLNTSLSADGRRLMLQQGGTDQERLLFFDAATLKPIE
jgi:WD40 repeat protein